MTEFVFKYREVRVQNLGDKNISIQYSSAQGQEDVKNMISIGTDSLSRRESPEARTRRDSNTRGQDSQGWD